MKSSHPNGFAEGSTSHVSVGPEVSTVVSTTVSIVSATVLSGASLVGVVVPGTTVVVASVVTVVVLLPSASGLTFEVHATNTAHTRSTAPRRFHTIEASLWSSLSELAAAHARILRR